MRYRNFKPKDKSEKKTNDAMAHPSANVSKSTFERITNLSESTGIPIARLMAIAIDNEFETANPFSYELPDISKTDYIEEQYFKESVKIHSYLLHNWIGGIGYEQLLICRADFGISDKTTVLLAVRELLKKEMLEEITTKKPWLPKPEKVLKIPSHSRLVAEEQKKYKKTEAFKKLTERNPLDVLDKNKTDDEG